MTTPKATIDARFSSADAKPRDWADAEAILDSAQLFTFVSVRTDGRPHATTLIAAWVDGAMYMCTGGGEQKAKNLDANPRCLVTHSSGSYTDGLDIVLEGEAVRETDLDRLAKVAERYVAKYGEEWRFEPVEGGFRSSQAGSSEGEPTRVYRIAPEKVLGFTNSDIPGQTRWDFR